MSAIIAGKECKKCNQEYWTSLGHPSWFNKSTKKVPEQLTPAEAEQKNIFIGMQKSGLCAKCYLLSLLEKVAVAAAMLGVDLGSDDAAGS